MQTQQRLRRENLSISPQPNGCLTCFPFTREAIRNPKRFLDFALSMKLEAIRDVLEGKMMKLRLLLTPYVSDEEQKEIEEIYGDHRKK